MKKPYHSEEGRKRIGLAHKGNGICPRCKKEPKWKNNPYCRLCEKEDSRKYYVVNRERELVKSRESCRKLKLEVILHYGGKCNCKFCGETHIDFLCIDHVLNDGSKLRKELKQGSGNPFYQWLKKNNYPLGYQVLCFNCNTSKHLNKGKCIHEIAGELPELVNGTVC